MRILNLLTRVAITVTVMLGTPPSNAAESPDTALAAYQRKDYEVAYQLALPAAQAGDASAQYLVGIQLWRGRGVVRNDVDAARWFASAAELNHSDAMTDLAAMYRVGEGVEKDTRRAFSLSMKAAEMGNASAQSDVGQSYMRGIGVGKDIVHARYWLERADAVESAQEAKARPAPAKDASGVEPKPISRLSDGCKPRRPPIYAMRKHDVKEVTGAIGAFIDGEGRIRGVTARNVSVDALKYDVVAFFSESLRSPECVLTESKRNIRIEIPFKFVMF